MKKFFIIILVLLAALVAFYFYAAHQAEKQIDAAIQVQADSSSTPFSVQYSSIDVSPFNGDIHFKDVNVIQGSGIERVQNILIDLRYIDFLNIYVGGLKYGLKQLSSADITLNKVSFVNRQTLQEFSSDTLKILYSGNMWDGIQSMFQNRPAIYDHNMHLTAFGNHYTKPDSPIGNFSADMAYSNFEIPKGSTTWAQKGGSDITFKHITWMPPATFQKKFSFFIQGFGYPSDALPISKMGLSYHFAGDSQLSISNGIVKTDLFTANFEGRIITHSTWAEATFNPLNVSVVNLSDQFSNVLANMEQLFGFKLPNKENGIHFRLVGRVLSPQLMHDSNRLNSP